MPRKRIGRSPRRRGVTAAEVLRRLASLNGVSRGRSYGYPAHLLGGKFFARLRDADTVLVLHVASMDDRDLLVQLHPEACFFTEHYRNYPTVLVRLAEVDRALLEEAIAEAWRQLAQARRVKTSKDAEPAAKVVRRSAAPPGRTPRPRRATRPRRAPHQ